MIFSWFRHMKNHIRTSEIKMGRAFVIVGVCYIINEHGYVTKIDFSIMIKSTTHGHHGF